MAGGALLLVLFTGVSASEKVSRKPNALLCVGTGPCRLASGRHGVVILNMALFCSPGRRGQTDSNADHTVGQSGRFLGRAILLTVGAPYGWHARQKKRLLCMAYSWASSLL